MRFVDIAYIELTFYFITESGDTEPESEDESHELDSPYR